MDSDRRSAQVERLELVDTGRRRRWSEDEKLKIVLSLQAPRRFGATARRYGVSRSLLLRWRRSFRPEPKDAAHQTSFVPAMVVAESGSTPGPVGPAGGGSIEIEFVAGARMRITGTVDAATLKAPPWRHWQMDAYGDPDWVGRMNSLALLVQEAFKRDPHGGDLYVFRGKSGKLIKVLWHDGLGMSLYAKRLERGRFLWPSSAEGVVTITPAQLGYPLEGIDWRMPQQTWQPQAAG
ncbi:IS66 family insertion sequence element accessory protein TnpB [Bradyrhizobium sp. DOA9]|uniref:IS66 family insertion sequence element accessory protein TnpB n=1 Tax=Bradyrhizobium sp. DOA9 TaxID=1126627 RepID=UPI0004998E86|nr:IS66 family insertion sequence element accessory protein TnpB [Bradyrhizobium sp. DOA9]GAJ37535.1 hypothetical 12.8 kDa protein y4hO [Bradyrhizobium sp. DOA9]